MKKTQEYIRTPKVETLPKVLGAYEEFYKLTFMNEQRQAFQEIEDRLASTPIICFIRGGATSPQCKASR